MFIICLIVEITITSVKNCDEKSINLKQKLKVCTFSRVIKEKGIDDAIAICRKANEILKKMFLNYMYMEQSELIMRRNSKITSV